MTTSSITSRRSLHLVDLENLVGDPFAPCALTLAAFDDYLALAGWEPGDHVIVASNRHLMGKVAFDLPVPCNTHAVSGRDAADLMLLSLAPPELVARRYGRLVVGSGDWIFAARAERARELGVHVQVVARADGCSRQLHQFDPIYLPLDPHALAA
jgi:hypothetical protein